MSEVVSGDLVEINIFGHNMRVKSSGGEEGVKRVVSCLEDKVEEARRMTGAADSMRLLLVAALNLVDENMRMRDELGKLEGEVESASSRMLGILELIRD